jgi:glycogen operon protein
MLLGGDEFARTQRGNNNAYCQDNDISWFDWNLAARNSDLVEFFRKAIAFTRRFPSLLQRKFLVGRDLDNDGVPDLAWFGPDLQEPHWNDPETRTLCCQMDSSEDGDRHDVDRLFFIFNGHYVLQHVKLPQLPASSAWYRAIDTSLPGGADFSDSGKEPRLDPGDQYLANPRSTVVLIAH